MAVYLTKEFARFSRKAGLADDRLLTAASEVTMGRSDADLGGGVYKQRVARDGSGKSGGFRTIILFRMGNHSFFVHGFAKSDKANVTLAELRALRKLADVLLGYSESQILTAEAAGELRKISADGGSKSED